MSETTQMLGYGGDDTRERAQVLIRREIRDGEPCLIVEAVVFDRANAGRASELLSDWAHTLPRQRRYIRDVEVTP